MAAEALAAEAKAEEERLAAEAEAAAQEEAAAEEAAAAEAAAEEAAEEEEVFSSQVGFGRSWNKKKHPFSLPLLISVLDSSVTLSKQLVMGRERRRNNQQNNPERSFAFIISFVDFFSFHFYHCKKKN